MKSQIMRETYTEIAAGCTDPESETGRELIRVYCNTYDVHRRRVKSIRIYWTTVSVNETQTSMTVNKNVKRRLTIVLCVNILMLTIINTSLFDWCFRHPPQIFNFPFP